MHYTKSEQKMSILHNKRWW